MTLGLPVGEPAINPVPRRMIAQAVREALAESDDERPAGFDIEIGCENGEEIARRWVTRAPGPFGDAAPAPPAVAWDEPR